MNIENIPTEQRNSQTLNIDEVSTLDMLRLINEEDKKVAYCVEKHLPQIADAIDSLAKVFADGGRIVYCGAGTSGRMGFMDSAEVPPTFGIDRSRIVSVIAGGIASMTEANEGAEDSKELCVSSLKEINFSNKDALVGIAASGRTPFVVGGLEYANSLGAVTVSITCNENTECEINRLAMYPISIYAGPEAITGSTRMKAGTVQKMVLNMMSTGIMIQNGKLYSNLMVNVQTNNAKLVQRAYGIVAEITKAPIEKITSIMNTVNNDVSLTVFMLLTECNDNTARDLLAKSNGHIKKALLSFKKDNNVH